MALPFFYIDDIAAGDIVLDEDTSKHITQVLRMKVGEQLLLTNGRGIKASAEIINDQRKKCEVKILETETELQLSPKIAIAISLIKNNSRFEWFLEKATEIGVNEIIPLICERTEKEKFRHERLQQILISAMLQSQQCWLPVLHQPTLFEEVVIQSNKNGQLQQEFHYEQKYIAHCLPEQKQQLAAFSTKQSSIILIGPEGDFSLQEINIALQHKFQPVALGNTRLRTETAGMVAAALLRNV
ncbi:16S rRNA (uracil(1498)-N(3))-methyltransferase [Chitinophagaceae bacterium LB-8]|uniref:Ribosomal RNA small subunit methyltransferase E n=1 Tax=Paraflavisolibacter caeni TaxID=2982496 RepID=A0A9X2XMY0_9BACT|nr:RsmE family RNA methyltransferase [Paraflavisolibacter caeni]MCU7548053.1 16S rRNA (uracil(1498)-N(3))-methyltransferase [Paraflavisolibacter caeni]